MADPVSAAILTVKGVVEIAKGLKDISQSFREADYKAKVAEIYNNLADVTMQLADIKTLVVQKDEEISKLKEAAKFKGKMTIEKHFYYIDDEAGRDGPFCQVCFDDTKKLMRITGSPNSDWWECKKCKNSWDNPKYGGPEEPRRIRNVY
jgi:ribosomal protein L37AE/L43A